MIKVYRNKDIKFNEEIIFFHLRLGKSTKKLKKRLELLGREIRKIFKTEHPEKKKIIIDILNGMDLGLQVCVGGNK